MARPMVLSMFIVCCFGAVVFAQDITVVLEPFPPFVTADGGGIVPTLLKQIEGETGYTFNIQTMPFSRAKVMIMLGKADVLGIVAKGVEDPALYEKCHDIEWGFMTMSDVYATDPSAFTSFTGKVVGTPFGNEYLAADVLGIDVAQVETAKLGNLFKMLELGRLDLIWFARDASMATIRDLGGTFHYQTAPAGGLKAGLAVPNTPEGTALGQAISKALSNIDMTKEFPEYGALLKLPDTGVYPQ